MTMQSNGFRYSSTLFLKRVFLLSELILSKTLASYSGISKSVCALLTRSLLSLPLILFFSLGAEANPVVLQDNSHRVVWGTRQLEQARLFDELRQQSNIEDVNATVVLISLLLSNPEAHSDVKLNYIEKRLLHIADDAHPETQFLLARLYLLPQFKQLKEAIDLLETLAEQDWLPAILLLAELKPNSDELYLHNAAELGSAKAQYLLGVKQQQQDNFDQAFVYYRQAALSQYLPAIMAMAENAKEQGDFAEALYWYNHGMNLGDEKATESLVVFYATGTGTPINVVQSIKLMQLRGISELDALVYLDKLYKHETIDTMPEFLRGVSTYELTNALETFNQGQSAEALYEMGLKLKVNAPSSAQEAFIKAREYYYRSAIQGYLPAYNSLGVLYEKGLGVSTDLTKAEHYYLYCAEHGEERSMLNLAEIYMDQNRLNEAGFWLSQVKNNSPRSKKIHSRFMSLMNH